MIEIKDAARAARDFAAEVFADTELRELRLEEVEYEDSPAQWRITLSWIDPTPGQAGIIGALGGARIYKVFVVDATSRQVRAMRIRETSRSS